MRAVELFAGAGGAALGLSAAGFEHDACIEWDTAAAQTLAAAGFPAICGDVRDLTLLEGLSPDALWSSFPCQCWSSAGTRKGAQDERNGWPWTVDAIELLRPRWFMAENVTGLTQHRGGCDPVCLGPEECPASYLDNVILEDLRRIYDVVDYRVLNAADYGVAQHRRRIFIVAGPSAIQWPGPTHSSPSGQFDLFRKQLPPWRTVRQALNLSLGTTTSQGSGRTPIPVSDGPSPTITGKASAAWTSAGVPYVLEETVSVIGGGTNPRRSGAEEQRTHRDITDEPCTTIAAAQRTSPWVVHGSAAALLDQPAPTVCAYPNGQGCGQWSAGAQQRTELEEASGRRRLTVAECATLQGFPEDHPWQVTKTSHYTQVGNAVPPILAQVIGEAVLSADRLLPDG